MTKLNFIFFADEITMTSGKMVADGIFDRINSYRYPATHSHMEVVANFNFSSGQYKEFFRITKDGSVILSNEDNTVEVDVKDKKHQFIHRISNLLLPEEGRYVVEIFINDKVEASNYFDAKIISNSILS